jgi:hypothetical protein
MLESGSIIKNHTTRRNPNWYTTSNSPKGSMLQPLLWSLVVDKLLWGLNGGDILCRYDTAMLNYVKFPKTVSQVLQITLDTV